VKSLQEVYEKSKDEFQRKAQIHIASILVAWKDAQRAQGDALNRTKEQAKELAAASLARIQKGEKFEAVASEVNDDPVAKSKRGDMGWIDDSKIDPTTFQAAQKLSKGAAISEVVETLWLPSSRVERCPARTKQNFR
jgi:parvulin-like peptidyl-prolyl isomerase